MEIIRSEALKNDESSISETQIRQLAQSKMKYDGRRDLALQDVMDQLNLSGYLIKTSPGIYRWKD